MVESERAEKKPGTKIHKRSAPRVAWTPVQRVVPEPLALPGCREVACVGEKRWTRRDAEEWPEIRLPPETTGGDDCQVRHNSY